MSDWDDPETGASDIDATEVLVDARVDPHTGEVLPPGGDPDPTTGFGVTAYNPAQQDVIDLLGNRYDEPRQFDAGLRHELRAELEHRFAPVLEMMQAGPTPDEPLFISKYPLAQVHGCEAKFTADRSDDFTWTVPSARGSVSHKAIELSIHWKGEPSPLDLVDEAMARLAQGNGSLADFLRTMTSVDEAELRAEANDRVAKFRECFPPLKKQWRPVTESTVKVELLDQRIILQGRVDLTLGQPRGTTARKVLIDLKSGAYSPAHVDDLRFYALIEAIRLGVPPRKLATYYLDQGRAHPEDVTESLLEAAIERTVDGATRIVELERAAAPAEPTKKPGPACRWCPVQASCDHGLAWLQQRDDDVGVLDDDF